MAKSFSPPISQPYTSSGFAAPYESSHQRLAQHTRMDHWCI